MFDTYDRTMAGIAEALRLQGRIHDRPDLYVHRMLIRSHQITPGIARVADHGGRRAPGRIVHRRRVVDARRSDQTDDDPRSELAHLDRRSQLIYFSIFSAVLSALLVCLVVAGAFVGALLAVDVAKVIAALFVLAMTAMIVALSLFLREVYLAVRAGGHRRP